MPIKIELSKQTYKEIENLIRSVTISKLDQ